MEASLKFEKPFSVDTGMVMHSSLTLVPCGCNAFWSNKATDCKDIALVSLNLLLNIWKEGLVPFGFYYAVDKWHLQLMFKI